MRTPCASPDWTVRQEPVYNARGGVIPGYRSNVRDTDGSVVGIVGDRCMVLQNVGAFHFTDDLIGGDARYETAGSLRYDDRKYKRQDVKIIPPLLIQCFFPYSQSGDLRTS